MRKLTQHTEYTVDYPKVQQLGIRRVEIHSMRERERDRERERADNKNLYSK